MPEREYQLERMRPQQLADARREADIAFLPLGLIEWHGPQNPLGLDAVKAHGLCLLAAKKLGGGAVCPPLLWGVPRESFNVGIHGQIVEPIADTLAVDTRRWLGFSRHGGMDVQEQWLFYQRLVRMTLENIAALGFRSIYLCSGHGPLSHFIRPVCVSFSRASHMADAMVTTDWSSCGHEPAGLPGDHAGKVETSQMLALAPETVDLSTLERHPHLRGVGAGNDAVDATAEHGRALLDAAATAVASEARWLVDNYPKLPPRHGHGR